MIRYTQGNLLDSDAQALVNTVNYENPDFPIQNASPSNNNA
jgi:hypothetical protein